MIMNPRRTNICVHPPARCATAIAIAAAVLALAACGRPSSKTGQPKTADQSTTVTGDQTSLSASEYQKAMLEWTRCMREHGVLDFPDPDAEGRFLIPKTIDVNSEAFKNARMACESKFPESQDTRSAQADADLLNQALEYARCMRANGVPSFPDPVVVDGRVIMSLPDGVDPDSDVFKKAQDACKEKRPVGLGG